MEETEIDKIKDYGKFKSAEELLAAYNALEREFTKRCQLIKTLQTAGEAACAQEDIKAEAPLPDDKAKPDMAEIESDAAAPAPEAPPSEAADAAVPEQPTEHDPAPTEMPTTQGLAPTDVIGYCVANAEECAELLSEIPQVMDACIAKYKQRLIGMGAAINAVRGAAVITPVRRPKTLKEAKILADEMLRN